MVLIMLAALSGCMMRIALSVSVTLDDAGRPGVVAKLGLGAGVNAWNLANAAGRGNYYSLVGQGFVGTIPRRQQVVFGDGGALDYVHVWERLRLHVGPEFFHTSLDSSRLFGARLAVLAKLAHRPPTAEGCHGREEDANWDHTLVAGIESGADYIWGNGSGALFSIGPALELHSEWDCD